MIRIELLPARCGDCIFVEYGDVAAPCRVLIDAGFGRTFVESLKPRLARIAPRVPIELLVVTHIDRDHIRGVLPLLEASPAVVDPAEVWFNSKRHLADTMGVADGDELAKILEARFSERWNAFAPFGGAAVKVPDAGALPKVVLPGGAVITLLSPYQDDLTKLDAKWGDVLGAWKVHDDDSTPVIDPNDDTLGKREPLDAVSEESIRDLAKAAVKEDRAEANGSSIAFIFEYAGRCVLFTGDAHPSVLLRSLERYQPDGKVALDAFKLSHHGSETNLSDALLEKVDCANWLVSTDGSSFGHPHGEAIAKILVRPGEKTLCFNAATDYTNVWDDEDAKAVFNYKTMYPERSKEGCVLELK